MRLPYLKILNDFKKNIDVIQTSCDKGNSRQNPHYFFDFGDGLEIDSQLFHTKRNHESEENYW